VLGAQRGEGPARSEEIHDTKEDQGTAHGCEHTRSDRRADRSFEFAMLFGSVYAEASEGLRDRVLQIVEEGTKP
jgi:hypothetical protein